MVRYGGKLAVYGIVVLCITALLVGLAMLIPDEIAHYYGQFSEFSQGDANKPSWFLWSLPRKSDDGSITRLKRSCSHPLKVYMYDIPRKFNFGLMTMDNKNEDLPWGNHAAPPWSQQWEALEQSWTRTSKSV